MIKITPENYENGRRLDISDGDLVTVSFNKGWFWKIVSIVTDSKFHHSGIAIWLDDGLYIAENNPQNTCLLRFSYYVHADDVEGVYVTKIQEINNKKIRRVILEHLRLQIKYSFWGLLVAGVERTFGISLPYLPNKQICSMFVYEIYREYFNVYSKFGSQVDPTELILYVEGL